MICTPHQLWFRWSNREQWGWTGHVARIMREVHSGFWWKDVKEQVHLYDLAVDERMML